MFNNRHDVDSTIGTTSPADNAIHLQNIILERDINMLDVDWITAAACIHYTSNAGAGTPNITKKIITTILIMDVVRDQSFLGWGLCKSRQEKRQS